MSQQGTTNALDRMPVLVEVEQDTEVEKILVLPLSPLSSTEPSAETTPVVEATPEVTVPAAETVETAAKDSDEAPQEHDDEPVSIKYIGRADVYEHGEFRFRRGKPVQVPSDIAVKLLALRIERFEAVKE